MENGQQSTKAWYKPRENKKNKYKNKKQYDRGSRKKKNAASPKKGTKRQESE